MDDTTFRRDFPSRLRELRERRGLRQTDLARRARCHSSSISHFETGFRVPTVPTFARLAGALGVSMDVLAGGDEETPIAASLVRQSNQLDVETRSHIFALVERLAVKPPPKR